jgi:hypothetical protein
MRQLCQDIGDTDTNEILAELVNTNLCEVFGIGKRLEHGAAQASGFPVWAEPARLGASSDAAGAR